MDVFLCLMKKAYVADLNCFFFFTKIVLPKVILPAPVLRVLPGYTLPCSATGFPPIYRALIRNSTVLVNTTFFWNAKVVVKEEANYTCVATNKYGTDVGEVSVIFTGVNSQIFYCRSFLVRVSFVQEPVFWNERIIIIRFASLKVQVVVKRHRLGWS